MWLRRTIPRFVDAIALEIRTGGDRPTSRDRGLYAGIQGVPRAENSRALERATAARSKHDREDAPNRAPGRESAKARGGRRFWRADGRAPMDADTTPAL
jgi:hypothetical protein